MTRASASRIQRRQQQRAQRQQEACERMRDYIDRALALTPFQVSATVHQETPRSGPGRAGSIPALASHFLPDGYNSTNDELANLQALTRGEHAEEHRKELLLWRNAG